MKFLDKQIIPLSHRINKSQINEGFSLVEVLIVVGILSITALMTTSLFAAQQKNMQVLNEKFQIQNLNANVLTVHKNQSACVANLTTGVAPVDLSAATTTVATPNTINLNALHYGQTATTPVVAKVGESLPGLLAGQMVVESIRIKNIMQTGNPGEYKGQLVVNFAPETTIGSPKPPSIDQIFTIGASPVNAAVVAGCGPATVTTGNCGPIGVKAGGLCGMAFGDIPCNYSGDPPIFGLPNCSLLGSGVTHLSSGFPTQVIGPIPNCQVTCLNGIWAPYSGGGGGGDGGDGDGN